MRNKAVLPALALIACFALPAAANAGGQQQPVLASLGDQDAAAQPAPDAPAPEDKDLVREHERFSSFARTQVERMNATIIGGRRQMHVYRGSDGLYHASYRAIDPGVVCLVRRSEASPGFYVGNLIYKEQVLESKGKSAAACKRGPFEPVSEKSNRLIYTSRRGGGWY